MNAVILRELQSRRKMQIVRLNEVADVTSQMMQAADRNDQLSMQMLLAMRESPLEQLREIDESIRKYVLSLPEEDAIRCEELLHGETASDPEEKELSEQSAKYYRILESVIASDKRLSMRVGGNRSFYHTYRE